jgi:succinylglutamate desuccinylase
MLNSIKKSFFQKIQEAQELSHPRVLVNVCSHGNETVGLDVQDMCNDLKIKNGSLTFNIGNPEAIRQGKRFIDSDLNRSFPGLENGTYEERIAFEMMKYLPLFDYVIDIHSTVSGMDNCLITEDNSPEIQKLISSCSNCDVVLHMTATKGSSIFTACRQSGKNIPTIAFEYGDNSKEIVKKTYDDLISILVNIGVVEQINNVKIIKNPNQFECYSTFPRSYNDILDQSIINYKLVKKGEIVAISSLGIKVLAQEDFYPILFGETNYTTIFGFMAKKI